jgi:hypothetical protein
MTIQYMSLGSECSPAAALRTLNIRAEALPFDWVESNLNKIMNCINDNFNNYHRNLQFNNKKTRLIDSYGIEFPHDYPFNTPDYPFNTPNFSIDTIGEGAFGEEPQKSIVENWSQFHSIALEKYKRRIERFYSYLQSEDPIIFACRNYSVKDVKKFGVFLANKFNKQNIYFVIASRESFQGLHIVTCNTEKNGVWNDASIWLEGINKIKEINNLL